MDKLRKKYPEHVPVICMHSRDARKHQKLIVPFQTTGATFQTIAREKCPWAMQGGEVLLCNKGKVTDTMEVPAQKTLQQLDSEYRAPDGGVYFTVEAAKDDVQEAPTVKEAPEGPQEFKMDENVPKDENVQQQENVQEKKKKAKAKAKEGSEDCKEDDIVERARRIRKKHPDRVPVLINQAAVPGLPALDKKLLIPDTMTCRDLKKILPKHIGLADLDLDWSKVILQLAGQAIGEDIEEHELVSAVYTRCVGSDDEGIMLSLERRGHHLPELHAGAGETQTETLSFSPPSAEELRVLELQLQEVNVAFEEAKKSQQLSAAKLAEQEERAWAAEERALKADQELAMRCQVQRQEAEAFQNQVSQAQEAREALEAQVISGKEEIEALHRRVESLEDDLQSALQSSKRDAGIIGELQKSMKKSEEALMVEARKNCAAEEKLNKLQQKVQEAADKEVRSMKMYADQEKEHQDKIRELEDSLRKVSKKLVEVEEEKAQVAREAEKQQNPDEEVKKYKDAVVILKDALSSKEEEISKKDAQVEKAKAVLKEVEAENRRLQCELETAGMEKIKLEKLNLRLQDEVGLLKASEAPKEPKAEEEDFVKLGWDSEGKVEEVTDFGFQKVDSA